MQHVRVDHDPQRELLQVQQLRYDIRLRVRTGGRRKRLGLPQAPECRDHMRRGPLGPRRNLGAGFSRPFAFSASHLLSATPASRHGWSRRAPAFRALRFGGQAARRRLSGRPVRTVNLFESVLDARKTEAERRGATTDYAFFKTGTDGPGQEGE